MINLRFISSYCVILLSALGKTRIECLSNEDNIKGSDADYIVGDNRRQALEIRNHSDLDQDYLLMASVIPKRTHSRVVGFQSWSIGKGIIILCP